MKRKNKNQAEKEKLIADIEEAMHDKEFRKGIKQFVRATSC